MSGKACDPGVDEEDRIGSVVRRHLLGSVFVVAVHLIVIAGMVTSGQVTLPFADPYSCFAAIYWALAIVASCCVGVSGAFGLSGLITLGVCHRFHGAVLMMTTRRRLRARRVRDRRWRAGSRGQTAC